MECCYHWLEAFYSEDNDERNAISFLDLEPYWNGVEDAYNAVQAQSPSPQGVKVPDEHLMDPLAPSLIDVDAEA